jgi:hypothetical protein
MAVTTPPSKLDPKGKAAKRRKSFCARMGGMKGPMKDEKGRPTRKALALRKWNCEEETNALPQTTQRGIYEKHLTPAETKKKEEIVMSMKKGLPGMKKRYGERAKEVLYATATKRAKQVAEEHIKEDALDADSINAISREARFRDPQSLKGVLHVIHNRMTSGKYASSAKGVLSQKGQFAGYGKGAAKGMNDADRQNIQKAWDDVSSGRDKDITGGANEFRTTSSKNRPGGQVIGGNTYYKTGSFAKAKTPEPTQVASAPKVDTPKVDIPKAPEAPKPTQVASTPETPKMQNPDQNITKVASAPAPTQVSQLDTKDKKQIAEISDTLVGRVSNERFWRNQPPSERLSRYIRRAQLREPQKKEEKPKKKPVKENMHDKDWDQATGKLPEQTMGTYFHPTHKHTARLSKEKAMKPDNIIEPGGVKGHVTPNMHTEQTKETTMDNQNLVNEAIENILENDLVAMKENLMVALQEKAQEKLEERKKEIAANYFAQ